MKRAHNSESKSPNAEFLPAESTPREAENSKPKTQNSKRSFLIVLVLFLIGDFTIFHVLKSGIDRYYELNRPAQVLCVGYSHTVLGIDAERMEKELGVPVAKYATSGANALDRLWMVRHYLEKQPSVKVVVYDVDPRMFDTEGLSSASYTLFLPYIDDPVMAQYLRQEATWQEYAASKLIRTARFRDQTINIALRGLLGKIENKKTTSIRVEDYQSRLGQEAARKIRVNPESRQCFLDTVDFLTRRDIRVVLVYLPTIDLLNAVDPAGQAGMIRLFREVTEQNDKVYFFDLNRDYEHRHELFYDLRHLNAEGNAVVTGRVVEVVKEVLSFGF